MDLQEITDQAFEITHIETGYDLKTELFKPLLSKARHDLKGLIGLSAKIIGFYEELIKFNHQENYNMSPMYHQYVKKFIDGDGSKYKGMKNHFGMYFVLREFKEDNEKKMAVAHFICTSINLMRQQTTIIDDTRLKALMNQGAEYARYYDPDYIFGVFLEIPQEVLDGTR